MTATQIDRLGERLKHEELNEADLRLLDDYRRTFSDAYETVIRKIRDALGLQPTGRPAKSTSSIVAKLRRETIRLSQMQDIAGCRLILPDLKSQDLATDRLRAAFSASTIVDRRSRPSYGYRAVHAVVKVDGKLIEIQLRTTLQHLWAQVSEKLADRLGSALKYGGGDRQLQSDLAGLSEAIAQLENTEFRFSNMRTSLVEQVRLEPQERAVLLQGIVAQVDGQRGKIEQAKETMRAALEQILAEQAPEEDEKT